MIEKKAVAIEDALVSAEKALDDALWEGRDASPFQQQLDSLRIAQSVGEKWETNW